MSRPVSSVLVLATITLLAPFTSHAAINARNNPDCMLVSRTCVDHANRLIAGQWVSRPCWNWQSKYNCAGPVVDTCQPFVNRGCGQIGSICTARFPSGACQTYTFTYRCLENKGSAFDSCAPLANKGCRPLSQQTCNLGWCVSIRATGGTATQHTYQCLVHKGTSSNTCTPFVNQGCSKLPGTTVTQLSPKITITHNTYQCLVRQGHAFNNCQKLIAKGCKNTATPITTYQPPSGTTTRDTYRCLDKSGVAYNNCAPWINKGCKQTSSVLASTSPNGGRNYNNTYQCLDQASRAYNNCAPWINKGCKNTATSTTYQAPNGITYTNTYQCLDRPAAAFDNCQKLIDKGCKQIGTSTCLYHKPSGACGTYDKTFQCLTKKGTSTTRKICKSAMCINGNCFKMNAPPSSDFLPAVTKFAAVAAAGHSLSSSGGVSIFKGNSQHCNKNIFGLKNCCKHAMPKSCPPSAKALDSTRQARQGIFVGTFCAVKAFFGACLRKQEVWCAFPSKLARIIQKQGRAQLGIGWGTPKAPSCRGLTPQELARIDFSKINLSEIYAGIMQKMKPMMANTLGNRVSGRVTNYFNRGRPSGGKVGP